MNEKLKQLENSISFQSKKLIRQHRLNEIKKKTLVENRIGSL